MSIKYQVSMIQKNKYDRNSSLSKNIWGLLRTSTDLSRIPWLSILDNPVIVASHTLLKASKLIWLMIR